MKLNEADFLQGYVKPMLEKFDSLYEITAEWQCSAGADRHGNEHGRGHTEHGNGHGYGHC